tara:strand:+ start:506 stop:928 length:423 start_codon:yes stop_codon:yes gene_type:complete
MILFDKTSFKLNMNYELSYILVPLTAILYIFNKYCKFIFMYHMIAIGIIGSIDIIIKFGKINSKLIDTLSLLCHILLLLVLFDFKKFGMQNNISKLLLVLANVIILFLPYWPYIIRREIMLLIYNFIYLALFICNKFIKF